MAKNVSFSYEVEHGKVTRIGPAETKKFLNIGRIPPAGKDRSLSAEAISTIDKAYRWSEQVKSGATKKE
jgi:hypothetical protein